MAYKIDKYLDGELKESVTIRNSKLAHVDAYNRLFDARPDPIKYPTYELKIFIDKSLYRLMMLWFISTKSMKNLSNSVVKHTSKYGFVFKVLPMPSLTLNKFGSKNKGEI